MRQYVSSFLVSFLLLTAGVTHSYAEPMPKAAAMPVEPVAAEKVAGQTADDADDDATPPPTAKAETKTETKTETKVIAKEESPVSTPIVTPPQPLVSQICLPTRRPGETPDEDDLPIVDNDETIPLPPAAPGARISIGALQTYAMGEEDSLLDVARYFKLGFVELRAANPKVDPWTPVPGEPVVIPAFHLLPHAQQVGIVVNLAQMRMFYFATPGKPPITFPIGIGREGLLTPTGETTIVRKVVGPVWYPTPRMHEEKPYLPEFIGPGPSNPLGAFALYLGWPEFRIHGTDKPWAIGRRVSSGCMRMYPEDIKNLFSMVPAGTKVTVVDQPILVGRIGDELYLEANPSKSQSIDIEINGEHQIKPLTDGLRKVITDAAGSYADKIDWDAVKEAIDERRGYPVVIAGAKKSADADEDKTEKKEKKEVKAAAPAAVAHQIIETPGVDPHAIKGSDNPQYNYAH